MGFTQVIVREDLYWHLHLEGGLLRKCFWMKLTKLVLLKAKETFIKTFKTILVVLPVSDLG